MWTPLLCSTGLTSITLCQVFLSLSPHHRNLAPALSLPSSHGKYPCHMPDTAVTPTQQFSSPPRWRRPACWEQPHRLTALAPSLLCLRGAPLRWRSFSLERSFNHPHLTWMIKAHSTKARRRGFACGARSRGLGAACARLSQRIPADWPTCWAAQGWASVVPTPPQRSLCPWWNAHFQLPASAGSRHLPTGTGVLPAAKGIGKFS